MQDDKQLENILLNQEGTYPLQNCSATLLLGKMESIVNLELKSCSGIKGGKIDVVSSLSRICARANRIGDSLEGKLGVMAQQIAEASERLREIPDVSSAELP